MPKDTDTGLSDIARRIQHTNVSPGATVSDIVRLCDEAMEYGFSGVMVQPCHIALCRNRLKGSGVRVCSAMGYPMGGALTASKVAEMRLLAEAGVDEVDFMANISFLADGEPQRYRDEIAAIVEAAGSVVTKIMLEFGAQNPENWAASARLAEEAGVTYVKNSSGWGDGGKATVEIVKLLRATATRARVKASGGIRTESHARKMIAAGADLLGTSAGPAIMSGGTGSASY